MALADYYEKYGTRITQASERLFVDDFLYPLVGDKIADIVPQTVFLDRTGRARRIDFAYEKGGVKIALEVNGETYHGEGIIPNEVFDDNLYRQNEILRRGYKLVRFSYSQLQAPHWRPQVMDALRELFAEFAPELMDAYSLKPTQVQVEALDALEHARSIRGWTKGVVVLPTGTGKTFLSAMDAKRHGGRVLFVVHRLDILSQSQEAYKKVWGTVRQGVLTGEERRDEMDCDVLFASKDTLGQSTELARFPQDWFEYVVIDEVHHGQTPSYLPLLRHFRPRFMLGMTATPDRTDRKDIFELFDYNNVYEIPLHDVIERGLLVPYTYIGLTDDVDYSRIRYQNHRYRVDDLERYLIIPERNRAILAAYLEKGEGNKAIGFCCSIKHAERMAAFFQENGVKAAAIHSQSPERDDLLKQFRNDELQVAFTVDLFNEGMDFPNVRVLLFLRPTESKTVFIQQLGRGLRLCAGKDRVTILDFIGNYKRANQIRKYLAKGSRRDDSEDENGRRSKKVIYEYSTGCEVHFDAAVEEILNRQDAADIGVDSDDLKGAYFALAEKLQRKPTKQELDNQGEFPTRLYIAHWGTWVKFLRDIGEYTEASYHYPQGTHLGHVLSILWHFGLPRQGTHLDDRFIRMRGGLGDGRLGLYQRQLKYKLQAAMELGIIEDDRTVPADETRYPSLTPAGSALRSALEPVLRGVDLTFPNSDGGIPSSQMSQDEDFYNSLLIKGAAQSAEARQLIFDTFLRMHAVQQMLAYLYHIARRREVQKSTIYEGFFTAPFVKRFCEQEGIEEATIEAARRRCPFLLNILAACGVLTKDQSAVRLNKLLLLPSLIRPFISEDRSLTIKRLAAVRDAWPANAAALEAEDLSILRELFGATFLTGDYWLTTLEALDIE